jgi:hypothetical protein
MCGYYMLIARVQHRKIPLQKHVPDLFGLC